MASYAYPHVKPPRQPSLHRLKIFTDNLSCLIFCIFSQHLILFHNGITKLVLTEKQLGIRVGHRQKPQGFQEGIAGVTSTPPNFDKLKHKKYPAFRENNLLSTYLCIHTTSHLPPLWDDQIHHDRRVAWCEGGAWREAPEPSGEGCYATCLPASLSSSCWHGNDNSWGS